MLRWCCTLPALTPHFSNLLTVQNQFELSFARFDLECPCLEDNQWKQSFRLNQTNQDGEEQECLQNNSHSKSHKWWDFLMAMKNKPKSPIPIRIEGKYFNYSRNTTTNLSVLSEYRLWSYRQHYCAQSDCAVTAVVSPSVRQCESQSESRVSVAVRMPAEYKLLHGAPTAPATEQAIHYK